MHPPPKYVRYATDLARSRNSLNSAAAQLFRHFSATSAFEVSHGLEQSIIDLVSFPCRDSPNHGVDLFRIRAIGAAGRCPLRHGQAQRLIGTSQIEKGYGLAPMVMCEGDEVLSGRARGGTRPEKRSPSARSEKKGQKGRDSSSSSSRAIGSALRSVYDDMLREEVPPCFLDLLGKLD